MGNPRSEESAGVPIPIVWRVSIVCPGPLKVNKRNEKTKEPQIDRLLRILTKSNALSETSEVEIDSLDTVVHESIWGTHVRRNRQVFPFR
jgi:hypothetical protein